MPAIATTGPREALAEALACLPDPPNLDDATTDPEALRALWAIYSTYAEYAQGKAGAIEARQAGRTRDALALEQRLDGLYRSLPRTARW